MGNISQQGPSLAKKKIVWLIITISFFFFTGLYGWVQEYNCVKKMRKCNKIICYKFVQKTFSVFLHRIPDPREKHHGLGDCVLEVGGSQAFSLPPLQDESRSLFHFYIHEEEQAKADRDAVIGRGRHCGLRLQGATDEDEHFLSNFNIPNFVNSEQSSSVDDLLLCEPPIITGSQSPVPKSLEPAHPSYDVIQY